MSETNYAKIGLVLGAIYALGASLLIGQGIFVQMGSLIGKFISLPSIVVVPAEFGILYFAGSKLAERFNLLKGDEFRKIATVHAVGFSTYPILVIAGFLSGNLSVTVWAWILLALVSGVLGKIIADKAGWSL